MNMKKWLAELPLSGKALPVLSFPSTTLLGCTVYDLTHNAEWQTAGICAIAERTDSAAALGMMDLSVEAEVFGCTVNAPQTEIPTVLGALLTDEDDLASLRVPSVGDGRTGMYLRAVSDAKKRISDRPVIAGMIGPFSLAGRLMEVSEILVNCIADPEFTEKTLRRVTDFLVSYAKAYKEAGLDGIFLAEPLAGLLSPKLEKEFSAPYVKEIVRAVQDDSFIVIYHNCGPNTPYMTESLADNGAAAYHFGDAVDLVTLLEKMPKDKPIGGNISPTEQFTNGTPESIYAETAALMERCRPYRNFFLSSGCDLPPHAKWENIDSFFRACAENKNK